MIEQLLSLRSFPDNPLSDFPADINKNHYCDIVEFALKHAPDVLDFVVRLCVKNEDPILENDVVRCAYTFSTMACSISRKNNLLKKIKSLSLKKSGITSEGMDALSHLRIFETSRNFRKDRDFLASVSENVLESYAKTSVFQV